MTDNMTTWCGENSVIRHLNARFFRGKEGLFENFNNRYTFKLYNPENMTKNYIRVCSVEFGKFLLIQGSLRKWYLADKSIGDTLNDFIQQEYDEALKLLFSLLEISDKERKYFYISRMEIGLTFRVNETCDVIMKKICGYNNSWYKPTIPIAGCKKYRTKNMSLTLYDKYNEISRRFKSKRKKTDEEELFMTENRDKNYFRMEFTMKGGKKEIEKRIKICTLEESVIWFDMFYIYYWDEVQKIEVSDIYAQEPIFKLKGKSTKEIMDSFKFSGIHHRGENEVNMIIQESENPQNTRNAIKKIQNNVIFRNSSYDKFSLLGDIQNQIICLMTRSDCLHLGEGLIIERSNI